jgi:hypothetical protein
VIGWWESRRIAFNLIVGTAGILTSVIVGVVGLGSSILIRQRFWIAKSSAFCPVIYGIMANICYTGGWMAELVVRRIWRHEADRFATLSFTTGLVFSVTLTLAPGIFAAAGGLFGLLVHAYRALHN